MLISFATIGSAARAQAHTLAMVVLVMMIAAGCSSGEAEDSTIAIPTTTTELSARQAAEPVDGSLDPNRTTTSLAPAPSTAQIVHVLGSIRSIADPSPNWQADITLVSSDLATVASLGCDPTNTTCSAPVLSAWATGGVDLVNVATSDAALAGAALGAFADELTAQGISVLGYGQNAATAVSGVTVRGNDSAISIHALSLIADDGETAGADSPGIAGPSTLDALLETVAERQASGLAVVVLVDAGSLDDRSPAPDLLDTVQQLVDVGVDAVIGHGPDFLQRFDRVGQSTVAYSLGNAAVDTSDVLRTDSAVLRLEFANPGRACLLPATATARGPLLDDVTVQTCG